MTSLKAIYAKAEPFSILKAIRRSKVFEILKMVNRVTRIITECTDPRVKICGNKSRSTPIGKSVTSHLIARRIVCHGKLHSL